MCKFIYTDKFQKLQRIFMYIHAIYAVILFLAVINILFNDSIESDMVGNAVCWITVAVSIIEGIFNFYKIKQISVPSVDLTLQYREINHDDPLQRSVVAQAAEIATSWANFALKRETVRILCIGIYEIVFAIMVAICLII